MASVAPGAFICILPEAPGPGYVLEASRWQRPGLSWGGAGTPRPRLRWFWSFLLCNCFTASMCGSLRNGRPRHGESGARGMGGREGETGAQAAGRGETGRELGVSGWQGLGAARSRTGMACSVKGRFLSPPC